MQEEQLKKCPYCAEFIKESAIVCRYCGRDLFPKKNIPQKQQKPKQRNWLVTTLALFGLIAAVCVCLYTIGLFANTTPTTTTYRVKYVITGTASQASVTYENNQGGTEQGLVNIPWEGTFTARRGQFVYISAQNEGQSGTVICQIWVDGVKWKESTSSGAFVIATCSGSVGGN